MFIKKIPTNSIYVFLIAVCIFTTKAHWVDDPGPVLVSGDQSDMTSSEGGIIIEEGFFALNGNWVRTHSTGEKWKEWDLYEKIQDSQGHDTMTARVTHKKIIKGGIAEKAEGTAYCTIWSATKVSSEYTVGKYEVHAQARGRWLYSSDKKKNSYFAGVTSYARKGAGRYCLNDDGATFSGVHLKGKSTIDSQADQISLELNWF